MAQKIYPVYSAEYAEDRDVLATFTSLALAQKCIQQLKRIGIEAFTGEPLLLFNAFNPQQAIFTADGVLKEETQTIDPMFGRKRKSL